MSTTGPQLWKFDCLFIVNDNLNNRDYPHECNS
jgi:hypothetical protein